MAEPKSHVMQATKIYDCDCCGKSGTLLNENREMMFAYTTFDVDVKAHSGQVIKAGDRVTICAECASKEEGQ